MAVVMPFLEIITRTCKRPALLAANEASIRRQTDGDYVHTILEDQVGLGIGQAQMQLAGYASQLRGRYVWILDDDDMCTRPGLVAELKAIAAQDGEPELIMMRMDHGPRGVLPDDLHWQGPPVCGFIGISAYVVRRDVFVRHRAAWLSARYASDFDFIAAAYAAAERVSWFDVVASRVQQIGMGVA